MTYRNFVHHPTHGKLWFSMELKNATVPGKTDEECRAYGPICELTLEAYPSVRGIGNTPDEAIQNVLLMLAMFDEHGQPLPTKASAGIPWYVQLIQTLLRLRSGKL